MGVRQSAQKKRSSVPTLVLSEQFLPNHGGTITWLLQAYSRYHPNEVVLVTDQHPEAQAVDRYVPFEVDRIPMKMKNWDPTRPASLWRYASIFAHVCKVCRRRQIQQVHCMKVLPEGLIGWCVQRRTTSPYVVYAHGEEVKFLMRSRKLRWLIPRLYRGAAAIISNSQHTKILLKEIGVPVERISVIHPGVDVSAFRFTEQAIWEIRERHNLDTSPILLTVGRLQRRKGHDMVIQALPFIAKQVPDVRYLIVGEGEERGALEELARRMGVEGRVTFITQVSEHELAAYYAVCDVFIMPNRQIDDDLEGFGIVFLEAGAVGKAVIGGRSGGAGEAIVDGKTGLLVDGTTIEEIASAATMLLLDPNKAKVMGEQGRWRAKDEFSWDVVVERTRAITSMIMQDASR